MTDTFVFLTDYIHTFTNYGISVSKANVFYFNAIPRDDIYEIDMHNLYPNVSSMFNVSNKRAKHALDSSYLWHCRLGHINKKCMDKLQRDGILQPTHDESLEKCKSCKFGKMARKPFPHQVERAKDLLGLIHTDLAFSIWFQPISLKGHVMKYDPIIVFGGYPKEKMGYYFYYLLENKILVARNTEFFENSLIIQEASGSHGLLESSGSDGGLELIQEEDTQPSKNNSKEHNEVAPIKVEPQNVEVPIRRSARIPQAPDRYGFYVDVEEYELGDLNEPPNYMVALSYPKFDKWLEAMNTKIQSMSKWLFKKKTNMDGNVHTFKARLVTKGYTQTYGVDYEETFSLVVDIGAIRILLAIAAFYDYEIWQMDVKNAFLNGHLSEDVYMVQPEGFVDLKHPTKYANYNVPFMD
ncbi:retrotransposon protein, putative, ty1-copia subclass [Tanacetum coccineum]